MFLTCYFTTNLTESKSLIFIECIRRERAQFSDLAHAFFFLNGEKPTATTTCYKNSTYNLTFFSNKLLLFASFSMCLASSLIAS